METQTNIEKPKAKTGKKKTWLVVVILVVVVLVAGAITIHSILDKQKRISNQKKEAAAFQSLQTNINNADKHGDNSQVIKLGLAFSQQQSRYASKSQLYYLDNNVALSYIDTKNYQAAITWEQDAINNSSPVSYKDYATLGNIYYILGNKTEALKYYKLAVAAAGANSVVELDSDGELAVINKKITTLEAAQ